MNAETVLEKNEISDHKNSGLELKYSIDSILLNIYDVLEDEDLENENKDIWTDFEFEIDENEELDRRRPNSLEKYITEGSVILSADFNNELIRKTNLFIHLYKTEYRYNKNNFLNKKFGKQKEVDIDFRLVENFFFKIANNPAKSINVRDILKADNILISMLMYAGVKKKEIYNTYVRKGKWKK